MDVIFKLIILFGAAEIAVGVASMVKGYHVLATVRQPPSAFAGVNDLLLGVVLLTVGTLATLGARQR